MIQQTQTKQIPKGWKEEPLIECVEDIIMGQSPKGESYNSLKKGLPLLNGAADIKKTQIIPKKYTTDPKKKSQIGDILVCIRATLGRPVISDKEYALGRGIASIRPNEKKVISDLIYYWAQTIENSLRLKSKGTAIIGITKNDFCSMPFFYPESKKEQTLIVQEIEKQFTRLDSSVKSLKSIKKKLEAYRKAVLSKLIYGDNKTFPEIISKEKNSMKRGPFGGSLKKEIFVPSGYLVYEQHHPINNDFNFGRYFINKEKFEEMKAFSVKPGDLLISCSGTIGKIAEIPKENFKEGIINQALLKITLDNSKVLNKYFLNLFQSQYIQKHLTKISRGVAIKNVPSVKELKTIKFPIPTIPEQNIIIQEIESKFSVIDKVEQVLYISLKKAERLRKSILKSAFEGKLVKMEEARE